MKEFNLNEYLKNPSQKVITRDGRAVRIICTDKKGEQPIVALITTKDKEDVYFYYKDGRWSKITENGRWININENCVDLFFAPTKKEGWINLYKDKSGVYSSNFIFETEKRAKEVIGENHKSYITAIKIEWEE